MALVSIPQGFWYPYLRHAAPITGATGTVDAATEKYAAIGRLYIDGRAASKTLNTTGSSAIGFTAGTVTFADGTTSVDIGVQGVDTTGPAARPDGVYTVKSVVTTAAPTSPALATNTYCVATPTTGTATLNHGDLIAIVWDMTARGGTDSLTFPSHQPISQTFPVVNAFAAAAWGATGAGGGTYPVVITFSDGTLGWIDNTPSLGLLGNTTWTNATNPDEKGMIFQVPFDCKVDALGCYMRIADANGDFLISLYEAAESAAAVMGGGSARVTVDAAQLGNINTDGVCSFSLATEISLSANTDYCVAVKANGTGNIRWNNMTLGAAAHRAVFPGGTTMRSVTRNDDSGNFSGSSTTLMFPLWVRISQLQDGVGEEAEAESTSVNVVQAHVGVLTNTIGY